MKILMIECAMSSLLTINKWLLTALSGLTLCTMAYGEEAYILQDPTVIHVAKPDTKPDAEWLLNHVPIFPFLKADPRQPRFSLGYRWNDEVVNSNIGMANLGGDLPLWRRQDMLGFDQIQLAVQGGVWALFDLKANNLDLVNSDWYGGIPLYATKGDWKYRFRIYHISSHLGDEYILDHNITARKNPSYEVIEAAAYYPILPHFNVYGVLGRVMHSDSSFHIHPLYFELGAEYYWNSINWKSIALKAQPYFAAHVRCWEMHGFEPSTNIALGMAWADKNIERHHITTSLEYFKGHSLEGEFGKKRSDYVYLQLSYAP
jgi:hypothetical protein